MSDFLCELDPEQRAAAEIVSGPLLIVAGAGTGKTRTLAYRLAHMVADRDIPPAQILAVTFTVKAADEMRQRVSALLPDEKTAGLTIGTFHALCLRMLKAEFHRLGRGRSFRILDEEKQFSLVAQVLSAAPRTELNPRETRDAISLAKSRLLSPEACAECEAPDLRAVAPVYRAYEDSLRAEGALDFDDLIRLAVELLERFQELREFYRGQFQHLMVDEYQDINPAQYKLVRLLADGHRNLCAVGDADQAIYAFRGANVRNFLDFQRDFPDAHIVYLHRNYRSTGSILAAAQGLIEHCSQRMAQRLTAERGDGPPVAVLRVRDERHEAQFVVEEIRRLLGGTSFSEVDADRFDREETPRWGFSDFAVLYRLNAQAEAIEESFRRVGIPYQAVGGRKLNDYPEIAHITACLRLILSPERASDDLRRVLTSHPFNLSAKRARSLESWCKSPLELLHRSENIPDLTADEVATCKHFVETISYLMERAKVMPVHHLMREMIHLLKLREGYDDGTPEGGAAYERLLLLAQRASRHEGLAAFLNEIETSSEQDAFDERANRVALMTLHAAKGLEFPVVFILGMEEGLVPYAPRGDGDIILQEELEEERRLLYVGMTRARDRLYLVSARRRRVFGVELERAPSRFLAELPTGFISFEEATHPRRVRRRPKKAHGTQQSLFEP